MIEIQQLRELDLEQVINLLLEEKSQPYNIYIPKETQEFFSDREAISSDYANLAYSGQLLFNISEKFEYEEVSPTMHESVLFTIEAKNIESLASVLLHISYGYGNDHPEDDEFSYIEESLNYLGEIEHRDIKKIACPYFVDISKEFNLE